MDCRASLAMTALVSWCANSQNRHCERSAAIHLSTKTHYPHTNSIPPHNQTLPPQQKIARLLLLNRNNTGNPRITPRRFHRKINVGSPKAQVTTVVTNPTLTGWSRNVGGRQIILPQRFAVGRTARNIYEKCQ